MFYVSSIDFDIFHFPGQKHKKWKTYFFVLNSTEQHLYYFDNDAVSEVFLE